jgi:hypothetical protein
VDFHGLNASSAANMAFLVCVASISGTDVIGMLVAGSEQPSHVSHSPFQIFHRPYKPIISYFDDVDTHDPLMNASVRSKLGS